MRRLLVLCLLVPWFAPTVDARQSLTLSERVGPSIDREERDYFRLLPEIDYFVEASFSARGDSVALIARTDSGGYQGAISRAAFDELRDYVENYERLYQRGDPIDITLLNDPYRLVAFRVPNIYERQVVVTTKSGETLRGLLIGADAETIDLFLGARYDWRELPDAARSIHYTDIEYVDMRPTGLLSMGRVLRAVGAGAVGAGVGYGVFRDQPGMIASVILTAQPALLLANLQPARNRVVGGNEALFARTRELLERYILFNQGNPPELTRAVARSRVSLRKLPPSTLETVRAAAPAKRWSVSVSAARVFRSATDPQTQLLTGGTPLRPSTEYATSGFHGFVTHHLSRRFGVGLEGVYQPNPSAGREENAITGASLLGTVSYVVSAEDPILWSGRMRISLTAAFGAARYTATQPLELTPQILGLFPSLRDHPGELDDSVIAPMAGVRAGVEYFTSPSTSLLVRVGSNLTTASFPAKELTAESISGTSAIYTREAFDVTPERLIATLAVVWHL